MTCASLEPFQMGGGVLSSLTPFLHEHSWAVLFGILPHCSELLQLRGSTCVCLNMQSLPAALVLRFRGKIIRITGQIYRKRLIPFEITAVSILMRLKKNPSDFWLN